jgi:DNA-binding SARP family transcriptional activator
LRHCLWDDKRPGNPRGTLQTYVKRLRHALGDPARIVTSPDGYHLVAAPDEVDLTRFRTGLAAAAGTADPAAQAALLRAALSEWRGQPLADVASEVLRAQVVPHLEEERLGALERCFDAELRTGRHAELVGELQEVAEAHPLRERFSGQLVLTAPRHPPPSLRSNDGKHAWAVVTGAPDRRRVERFVRSGGGRVGMSGRC